MERGVHLERLVNVGKWNLPITEKIEKQIISLPIYPELKKTDQDYIIDRINLFFKKK